MIAPTSGCASVKRSSGGGDPPSEAYAAPVATIVIVSPAMLKMVRYNGYGCLMFKEHCAHTPTTATTIAGRGPSRSSAVRSAAYDTERVDPLESEIGSVTFQIEVSAPVTSSAANRIGRG